MAVAEAEALVGALHLDRLPQGLVLEAGGESQLLAALDAELVRLIEETPAA